MTDFWRGRRVLVTGGTGFVGANLCRALLNLGANVRGLDLCLGPSWDVLELPRALLTCGSIRDPWLMKMEFSTYGIEVVFHLAGMGHIADCQAHPRSAWENNVEGTWGVLEACRMMSGQVKAVVVASSNEVYPPLQGDLGHPWTEADPIAPATVYGTSKACQDLLAQSYGRNFGLPVAALRHCNAFGKADPHRSHIVAGTICDLLEQRAPIIRGDGTPIKGYLDVARVVNGYLLLAEGLASGNNVLPGSVWNAAPIAPISVLALVDLLIQISGRDIVPLILDEDTTQHHYVQHLDSSRLRMLGWDAGDFKEDLPATFNWYKTHGGLAWQRH